jgi:hypothetical protein
MLTSCDEAALLAGENLLQLAGEFMQFSVAQPLGDATYRLAGLLRGRFDSAIAAEHVSGCRVLLLEAAAIKKVKLPRDIIGSRVTAQVHGPDDSVAEASLAISGSAMKPWSPDHLCVHETDAGLHLSWIRRCKEGTPWPDAVDAPLGANRQAYAVQLSDTQGHVVELNTDASAFTIETRAYSHLGLRPWQLEVRQLGDFAAGNPLIHDIH